MAKTMINLTDTTPRIEVISKRITIVSKAQFGETDIAGSQFVRSQNKESSAARDKFSVGRLALMGLLGGGLGYAIGSQTKGKNKWMGAAIGGAAGAVGSMLLPSSADEVDVAGAMVLPGGKSSIMFVGPKKRTRGRLVPMLVTNQQTELPGWAGAIIAHGMLVQRGQMHYIWNRSKYWDVFQVAPDYGFYQDDRAVPAKPGATPWGVSVNLPANFHNSTLWTERMAEWPSPAWPRYGINWAHPCEYNQAGMSDQGCNNPIGPWPTVTIGNVHKRLAALMRAMAFSKGDLSNMTRRAKNQGLTGATLTFATPQVGGLFKANTHLSAPKFWDANKVRFNKKYDLMMRRAQWFVWAAEMFRIHAGVSEKQLDHWKMHCAQWGVGCANDDRLGSKKTMLTYHSSSWIPEESQGATVTSHGKMLRFVKSNPIAVKMSLAGVQEYIRLVMEQTPGPFITPPSQQLMVPPTGETRWLLDIPDQNLGDSAGLGSILPPLDVINQGYFQYLCDRFNAHGPPQWAKVTQIVFAAVIAVAGTIVGGPLGAGAGGALFAIACTVLTTLIRAGMSEGKFSTGDIVKAVGGLLSQIVAETGLDFDEMFGDTMGDLIANLEGLTEKAGFADSIGSMLSDLNSLKKDLNWPFVDEMLGTVLNGEALADLDVDAAINELSHA